MPLISFTPADKMLAVTLEAGFQPAIVSEIDGPKQSSSGKSVNFFFTFRVSKGKYEGKEVRCAFTSGSEQASVLGTMMWMPTAFMRQVYAAVKNVDVSQVPDQFDTDVLLNSALDIKIDVNTGDAGLFNTVSQFVPAGKGMSAKAPF